MKIELYGADGKWQRTILIERGLSLDWGAYYAVTHKTPSYERLGLVNTVFKGLDWFSSKGSKIVTALGKDIDIERDLIAEITDFFPHGPFSEQRIPEKVKRNGVGTHVLRSIVEDLKNSERIDRFYVSNPSDSFYRRLKRFEGFSDFREFRFPEDPKKRHIYARVA